MHNAARAPAAIAPVVALPAPALVRYTATVTAVDAFGGRPVNPTRFGVGEELDLGFTTLPMGAVVAPMQWVVKSGPATLTAPVPTNGAARLVMGATAGTVVLELRTVVGPGAGLPQVKLTKTLWVVEPSSADIVQEPGTGVYHKNGTASAGFYGLIQFRPTDVSFYRCQFREGSAPIRATGSLKVTVAATAPNSQASGQQAGTQQELANLAGSRHPVMGTWLDISTGNIISGSEMVGHDDISSATIDPPFAAGTFDWDIHWIFRVIGSGQEKTFYTATHSEVMAANGDMTINKAGFGVTCHAADPDSNK